MMYFWLVVGFICLIKGADFFVDGSSSIAKILKVPSIIIGLTIVAMGTSAPETAVSISAAFKGANEIAVSNVVGSNFFNLLMVVGVCALMQPVHITKDLIKRDYPISILATVLLLALLLAGKLISGEPGLSNWCGILMLIFFAAYLIALIRSTLASRTAGANSDEEDEIKQRSLPVSIFLILVGLAGVIIGGDLVVDNATLIAKEFGMSNTLIGLTIVAIGTSLPELVTSIVAAKKNEADLALGNVVGSNIFNVLLVLGISSTVHKITVNLDSVIDVCLLIAVNLIVLAIILKKSTVGKGIGAFMIAIYVLYTAYILARNYGMLPM